MSIDITIKDGKGQGRKVEVDENNALVVTDTGIPPEKTKVTLKPFSTLLANSSGTTDMRVNGSTTNVDFYIQAGADGDRFIHTLAFTIADAGAQLNEFGNLTALTNGCQLIYQDSDLGDVVLADNLKSNFDFVQACNFEPTFGTGTAAFLASNVVGTSEAYVPILDIQDVFGVLHGIRLPKGTTRKLLLRIRDNVSTIDRFDVRAYGFDRIAKESE